MFEFLAAIADALLSTAEDALVSAIVDDKNGQEGTNADVLRRLANDFATVVAIKLRELQIQNAVSELHAVKLNLRDAIQDAPDSDFRIADAIIKTSSLAEQLRDMGVEGLFAFTLAASLHLSALEFLRRRGHPEQVFAISGRALNYSEHVSVTSDGILKAIEDRFSACALNATGFDNTVITFYTRTDLGSGGPVGTKITFFYKPLPGGFQMSPDYQAGMNQCATARTAEIKQLQETANDAQVKPLKALVEKWRKLAVKFQAQFAQFARA